MPDGLRGASRPPIQWSGEIEPKRSLMERVIVIGAGVGGLAAAVRLQNAGYQVALYEKEPQVGGKMNRICEKGFTFDVGPDHRHDARAVPRGLRSLRARPRRLRSHEEGRAAHGDSVRPRRTHAAVERPVRPDRRLGGRERRGRAGLLRVPGASVQALPHRERQLPRAVVPWSRFDFYNPKSLVAGVRLHTLGRRVLVGGPATCTTTGCARRWRSRRSTSASRPTRGHRST